MNWLKNILGLKTENQIISERSLFWWDSISKKQQLEYKNKYFDDHCDGDVTDIDIEGMYLEYKLNNNEKRN